MSVIVSGIVNSTIGLLCNKLRDYTAQKLDINDSKIREKTARELDDIKTKFHGLSGKDLLASISYFKQGVPNLYISLKTYSESCEKHISQAHTEDDKHEDATATVTVEQFPVKKVEGDATDTASDLREFIGNLAIASEERYQSTEDCFEKAKRLATKAFNNTALSTEDRVMASKRRIACRILECLDDPEVACHNCLLCLKELQDLSAVPEMFTVWLEKGFISRLRARFNQTKRNAMVESIQAITIFLLNLILQYTKMRTDCLNWPTIKIGMQNIYHPILQNKEIVAEFSFCGGPIIRFYSDEIDYFGCAVTSKCKVLSKPRRKDSQHSLEITKPNGEFSLFCTISSENDGDILNKICCFAVDEDDKVYIVIKISSRQENIPTQYKLLTFDENGRS